MEDSRDYLETKRIVESARNLTIHGVAINEARINDSWQSIYFEFRPNLLKLRNGISNWLEGYAWFLLIPVSVSFEKVKL